MLLEMSQVAKEGWGLEKECLEALTRQNLIPFVHYGCLRIRPSTPLSSHRHIKAITNDGYCLVTFYRRDYKQILGTYMRDEIFMT